jgi:hypothetical protein
MGVNCSSAWSFKVAPGFDLSEAEWPHELLCEASVQNLELILWRCNSGFVMCGGKIYVKFKFENFP